MNIFLDRFGICFRNKKEIELMSINIGNNKIKGSNIVEKIEVKEKMYRQISMRPLVEAFFIWVKESQSKNQLSRGKTLDGINYCINQEASLKSFLEDRDIPWITMRQKVPCAAFVSINIRGS